MAKSEHDPLLAFRFPEFRYYVAANFLFTCAFLIQEVIIGYELYKLTKDPKAIAFIGLSYALPFMALSLLGGHFADKWSKKKILLGSLAGIAACSLTLFFVSKSMTDAAAARSLQYVIYAVVALTGGFYAFYSPTASSLKPLLVPRHAYENAATWGSAGWQAGTIVGPALSGFIYAWGGFSNTILAVIFLQVLVVGFILLIGDRKVENPEAGNIFQKVKEGIAFVGRTRMLLYSISLDLFAVLFGGVVAILAVFAEDILKVGPQWLGVLRAAPSVGAMLMLLLLTFTSVMDHAWKKMLLAVAGFGVATIVFALSKNLWLSIVALFFTGAFDAVSVVIRHTILQLVVPDEMRGRVGAVNGIFLSASNELGAFESGMAASWLGTVRSVVAGGVLSLAIVGWVWWKSRDLFDVDLRDGSRGGLDTD
ncbi:MAG: MFS transporter [Bacteroidetes bacterium]|nr:MFS transporter [Bacteroidota bacterium]